jgi:hypothetical protein
MDAQAISNATAKNGLAGLAISGGLSRQGTGALVAISSLERKAPGETGDETNNARRRRRWEGVETMIKSRKAIGKQALRYAMAGIAVSCLGAAGFAAPMTITPKAKVFSPSQRTAETKTVYAPLGKGPAFQLGRAAAGEDEDCVRVTRMVGPDGRVYVTRGLICQE